MARTSTVKERFAEALEEMMRTTPLSKIRVAGLCDKLGVERRVFYYHFRDKYDLVAWMFRQDYKEASAFGTPYSKERYAETHRKFLERRDFYRRAFEDDSQNSINDCLSQCSTDANEEVLKRYLGVSELSDEYALIAAFSAHGSIDCVSAWLKGELKATPEKLTSCLFECMPQVLRDAYREVGEHSDLDVQTR